MTGALPPGIPRSLPLAPLSPSERGCGLYSRWSPLLEGEMPIGRGGLSEPEFEGL